MFEDSTHATELHGYVAAELKYFNRLLLNRIFSSSHSMLCYRRHHSPYPILVTITRNYTSYLPSHSLYPTTRSMMVKELNRFRGKQNTDYILHIFFRYLQIRTNYNQCQWPLWKKAWCYLKCNWMSGESPVFPAVKCACALWKKKSTQIYFARFAHTMLQKKMYCRLIELTWLRWFGLQCVWMNTNALENGLFELDQL